MSAGVAHGHASGDVAHALVTGFGPFEDVAENASGLVARMVEGEVVAGLAVRGVELATTFSGARARVAELAEAEGCRAVIALGVWGGDFVRLERRAAGRVESARPDVCGEVWRGRAMGDDAVCALPLEAWAREVDAAVSEDCGGYVCNATYHALLEVCAARAVPAVFMHIPRATDEAALEAVARRVRALVALMTAR